MLTFGNWNESTIDYRCQPSREENTNHNWKFSARGMPEPISNDPWNVRGRVTTALLTHGTKKKKKIRPDTTNKVRFTSSRSKYNLSNIIEILRQSDTSINLYHSTSRNVGLLSDYVVNQRGDLEACCRAQQKEPVDTITLNFRFRMPISQSIIAHGYRTRWIAAMSVLKGTSPDNSLDRRFLRSVIDFVPHGRREKNQRFDRHRHRRYPSILPKRAVDGPSNSLRDGILSRNERLITVFRAFYGPMTILK